MKKTKFAVSVYEGLKDYPIEKNFEYLNECANLGIKLVFTSAHIPEAGNIQEEIDKLASVIEKNGMQLIIDVSKPMMENFVIPKCTYALRLDWGFNDDDIVELSNTLDCNIELNASTISIEKLVKLLEKGLNPKKTRMSYNFYPKPFTGLDIYELIQKNMVFHELGFTTMAFIPSLINKRPPLYKGVPSIEAHRYKPTYISTQELIMTGIDEIGIGDAYSTEEEILEMISCTADCIQIPLVLTEDVPLNVLKILNGPHHSRPDQSPYLIRSSTRSKVDIEPKNNGKIKKYQVTVDNKLNLRYMGEVGIWMRDVECEEANVIGYVPEYGYDLLNLLKPGTKFSFMIEGKKDEE
ncbi:MAG: DUF871 domain-containing protein [Bacilli bacterium]|nr:DUF871 domain-containing protein [Bacilli bacterium]